MAEFDFPYHTVETQNPESSVLIQLGGGYQFTTPPTAPDQRTFVLHFPAMKYFTNSLGDLDETITPSLNMFRLIKFYQTYKTYKSFDYTHPVYGLLKVRFSKPLVEPEVLKGGFGITKDFEVNLIEVI